MTALRAALREAHIDRRELHALPPMPALDREGLIRAGLLRPDVGEVTTYETRVADVPVLCLDDTARAEAARAIAKPRTDSELAFLSRPPPRQESKET